MAAHVFPTEKWWQCPSCGYQHTTDTPGQVVTPLHACPHWAGLAVALVEVHSNHETPRARHRLVMRDDYVGREEGIVWGPGGAPISAVHTERPDGSHDTHVFAPIAGINYQQQ